MRTGRTVFILLALSFFFAGCSAKLTPEQIQEKQKADNAKTEYFSKLSSICPGPKVKLTGAERAHKDKMTDQYGFLIGADGYKAEKKIFERCSTVEAIDSFFKVFWSIRDPDKTTPEPEYKNLIDERIADVRREVFFQDIEIPGTTFLGEGRGMRGDMARVYILRGAPHFKVRIQNMSRLSDLMAWVYFDPNGRPLFIFIFYNKGYGYELFRNHMEINSLYAFKEVLRVISRYHPVTDHDYEEVYLELSRYDTQRVFFYGLQRFSYYDTVRIDSVLDPPMPESITAKVLQPRILGIPNTDNKNMVESGYFASIPGYLRIKIGPDGKYNTGLLVRFNSIDWEHKDGKYVSRFDLAISITEEQSRKKTEFLSGMAVSITPEQYNKHKEEFFPLSFGKLKNYSQETGEISLPDMLAGLPPGYYEIKVRLLDQRSMKSGVWFEYITVP